MSERFERFTLALASINRSMRRLKDTAMAEHSLHGSHTLLIYLLYRHKRLTAKELESLSRMDKAAVSRALEALSREKYIALSVASSRRYRGTYHLTERGFRVAQGLYAFVEQTVGMIGEGIEDEEREIFYRVLEKIAQNLVTVSDAELKKEAIG